MPIRTEGSWVTSRFPDNVARRAIPEMPSKITKPSKGSIKDSLNLIVGLSLALCRLYYCLEWGRRRRMAMPPPRAMNIVPSQIKLTNGL